LSPLLDSIYRGWDQNDDPARALCQMIGEHLRDRLALERLFTERPATAKNGSKAGRYAWKYHKPDWSAPECVKAGHWLMQSALSLSYFDYDEDGFPTIADDWRAELDALREDLLRRDPAMLPHTVIPPDWTGWCAEYSDRMQATFVRDWHPE